MKTYAVLIISLLAVPVMAATISITGNGDLTATITVTDAANIVALALDVDVDGGAVVTAVTVDTANFNIYPDAAYTQELGDGYEYGTGSPVCTKTVPGEIALPQSSFALCFANLNGEATAGADGATSVAVTVTVDEACNITVCENATRGGIIAVDGSSLMADCAVMGAPPPCRGDTNLDGKISIADMSTLIDYLSPWYANSTPPYCVYPIPGEKEYYDVNGDGKISLADMAAIIAFLSPAYADTIPPYTYNGCMP